MKAISPGHKYLLTNFVDNDPDAGQELLFVRKEKEEGTDVLKLVHDGTTNEEVLRALIHRIKHLDSILPNKENKTAILHLTNGLKALERRHDDRQARGVTGTSRK